MKLMQFLAGCLGPLVISAGAHAVTLAHWEADNTPGPGGTASNLATLVSPNVFASAVNISAGSNNIDNAVTPVSGASLSGNPVFRVLSPGNWDATTPTKYYSFSVGAIGANAFGPNSLTLDEVRFFGVHSGINRDVNFQLDVSTDGVMFTPAGGGVISDDATLTWEEYSVDLSSMALADLSNPINFRLYLYGIDGGSGSTISIDDIRVFGDLVAAQAIPEPRSIAAWGVMLVGFAVAVVLRRRKATA